MITSLEKFYIPRCLPENVAAVTDKVCVTIMMLGGFQPNVSCPVFLDLTLPFFKKN
jgi:hypothetical protein